MKLIVGYCVGLPHITLNREIIYGAAWAKPLQSPKKNAMQLSDKGLALIKLHESLRLTAYRCPAGVLTIGYGHTGNDVRDGMSITQAQADALLRQDVKDAEATVNRQNLRISQNQFDALVSLTFNIGSGNFGNSTLLRMLRVNPASANVPVEWMKWVRGGGRVLPGLTRRRTDELNLYRS